MTQDVEQTYRQSVGSEPVLDPQGHVYEDDTFALCHGNPIHGFSYIGPFRSKEDAIRYADDLSDDHVDRTWLVALSAPLKFEE